jgi:hypothetical protein
MDIQDCECYKEDNNCIIWQYNSTPDGVFIIHIGGVNKRLLYRMMKTLIETEFKNLDVFIYDNTRFINNSNLDGEYKDGTKVYRFTGIR